jgi:hypothetical protein
MLLVLSVSISAEPYRLHVAQPGFGNPDFGDKKQVEDNNCRVGLNVRL